MKIVILIAGNRPDNKWRLAKQIGVNAVVAKLAPNLTGSLPPWDFDSLARSVESIRAAGFEIVGLEGDQFDVQSIKTGSSNRNEDIDRFCRMLENMGRLGVPMLCYNFMARVNWYRNEFDLIERGGAVVSGFDEQKEPSQLSERMPPISEEAMWDNFRTFLETTIPVAESSGVKMALHPDDPPVSSLQGVARIFSTMQGFRRAYDLFPSKNNCVTFCQANFSLMQDCESIEQSFDDFKDRVAFIHFRDVSGVRTHFRETFHDNGPHNMPMLLKHYDSAGFTGPIRPDHVPLMAGEKGQGDVDLNDVPTAVGYEMQGRLFAIGYMRGIMHALDIPVK